MSGRPLRRAALAACAITVASCASNPGPQPIEVMNERDIRRERIEVALDVAAEPAQELENEGEKTLHVDLVSEGEAGADQFAYVYLDATAQGWNAAHQDFASCWTDARRQAGGAIGTVETLMRQVDVNGLKACLDARGYEGAFFASGEHLANGPFENAAQPVSLVSLGLRGVESGAASAPAAARTLTPATPMPAPAPDEAPYLMTAEVERRPSPRSRGAGTSRRPGLAAPADDAEAVAAPETAAVAAPVAEAHEEAAHQEPAGEDPMAALIAAIEAEREAAPAPAATPAPAPEMAENPDYVPVISDTPIDVVELEAADAPVPAPMVASSRPAPGEPEEKIVADPVAVEASEPSEPSEPASSEPAALGEEAPMKAASVWAEAEPAHPDAPRPSMFDVAPAETHADHEMIQTAAVEQPAHATHAPAAPAEAVEASTPSCAGDESARRHGWSRFIPGRGDAPTECANEAAAPNMVAAAEMPAEPPVAPHPTLPAPPTAPAAPVAPDPETGDKPRPAFDRNLPSLEELLGEHTDHSARERESTRGVVYVPLED